VHKTDFKVGDYCLALYSEPGERFYYRARIQKMHVGRAEVFIDMSSSGKSVMNFNNYYYEVVLAIVSWSKKKCTYNMPQAHWKCLGAPGIGRNAKV